MCRKSVALTLILVPGLLFSLPAPRAEAAFFKELLEQAYKAIWGSGAKEAGEASVGRAAREGLAGRNVGRSLDNSTTKEANAVSDLLARGATDDAYSRARRAWRRVGQLGRQAVAEAEYLVGEAVRAQRDALADKIKQCLAEALVYATLYSSGTPPTCQEIDDAVLGFVDTVEAAMIELRLKR